MSASRKRHRRLIRLLSLARRAVNRSEQEDAVATLKSARKELAGAGRLEREHWALLRARAEMLQPESPMSHEAAGARIIRALRRLDKTLTAAETFESRLALAVCLSHEGPSREAGHWYRLALASSRQAGKREWTARCYLARARMCHYHAARRAIFFLKTAIRLSHRRDVATEARGWRFLAAHHWGKDPRQSAEAAQHAYRLYRRARLWNQAVEALGAAAGAQLQSGDSTGAVQSAHRLVADFEKFLPSRKWREVYPVASGVFWQAGAYREFIAAADKILHLEPTEENHLAFPIQLRRDLAQALEKTGNGQRAAKIRAEAELLNKRWMAQGFPSCL